MENAIFDNSNVIDVSLTEALPVEAQSAPTVEAQSAPTTMQTVAPFNGGKKIQTLRSARTDLGVDWDDDDSMVNPAMVTDDVHVVPGLANALSDRIPISLKSLQRGALAEIKREMRARLKIQREEWLRRLRAK